MAVLLAPVAQEVMDKMLSEIPATHYESPFSGVKEALETFPAVHVMDFDGKTKDQAETAIRHLFPPRTISIRSMPDGTLLVHRRKPKEE